MHAHIAPVRFYYSFQTSDSLEDIIFCSIHPDNFSWGREYNYTELQLLSAGLMLCVCSHPDFGFALCIHVRPRGRAHQSEPLSAFENTLKTTKKEKTLLMPPLHQIYFCSSLGAKQRNRLIVIFPHVDKGMIRSHVKVVKDHNFSTHCRGVECRAAELQPSSSRLHSFSTWAQPSSLLGVSKLARLCCLIMSECVCVCVCEGWGSGEFPVRSTRAGQARGIKPGLYSAALYRSALLRCPPHLSLSFSLLSTPPFLC